MPEPELDHLSRMGDAVQAYESRKAGLLVAAGICGLALLAMLLLPRAPRDDWGTPVIVTTAASPSLESGQLRRTWSTLSRQLNPEERREAASVLRTADPNRPGSVLDAARQLPPDVRSSLLSAVRGLSAQQRDDAAATLATGYPSAPH